MLEKREEGPFTGQDGILECGIYIAQNRILEDRQLVMKWSFGVKVLSVT